MRKAPPYVVDILIIAVFVLAPGVRGYSNWAVYEYILWGVILFYILYLRHTPRRK
jgi:purine-cytosine permease-like protein